MSSRAVHGFISEVHQTRCEAIRKAQRKALYPGWMKQDMAWASAFSLSCSVRDTVDSLDIDGVLPTGPSPIISFNPLATREVSLVIPVWQMEKARFTQAKPHRAKETWAQRVGFVGRPALFPPEAEGAEGARGRKEE